MDGELLLCYWINVFIVEKLLDFDTLKDLVMLKQLSLVSKYFAQRMQAVFSNKGWFILQVGEKRLLHKLYYIYSTNWCEHYSPRRLKCIYSTESLSQIPSVRELKFSNCFNKSVDNLLPSQITRIYFGTNFNHSVNNLPQCITHLVFGFCFNRPVNSLPPSLTHLTFGVIFNQKVDKLPLKITHLCFGEYSDFNHPVEKLPPRIVNIKFGSCFDKTIDLLPHSITHLKLGHNFNHSFEKLPPALTHVSFGRCFHQVIQSVPHTLKQIEFSTAYDLPLDCIPSNVIVKRT
eukprot:TRINITY_DN1206_c0_g1_i4.p1 TRINITY_DN1206_c0_g1~~TRINITY_DN1206_c0_g1_i4.p1  ORF type:complete len:289 (-),score=18.05 TRINITY_DN1206_c0_g1_i4:25-891(-)